MSFSKDDVNGLDDVLKKGVKRVKHKDYEAEFHDPETLLKSRAAIARATNPDFEEQSYSTVVASKGL